ncbi:MAG TPA: SRPBCC family protein [Streptosporangiaceae bacterium]|nr:SRPBCC family protein [Streptosporangiaceae bacterium]
MTDDCPPVRVSRRIAAPASTIFGVLTDPVRHLDLDGSQMLRGAVTTAPVTGVGDVFVMKMYFAALGDYEMNNHVVEYEPDRLIGWEPHSGRGHPEDGGAWGQRWSYELTPDGADATVVTEIYDCSRVAAADREGMDNGRVWTDSMAATLERLDRICTGA